MCYDFGKKGDGTSSLVEMWSTGNILKQKVKVGGCKINVLMPAGILPSELIAEERNDVKIQT